jgi:hypothetical protein
VFKKDIRYARFEKTGRAVLALCRRAVLALCKRVVLALVRAFLFLGLGFFLFSSFLLTASNAFPCKDLFNLKEREAVRRTITARTKSCGEMLYSQLHFLADVG